MDEAAARRRAHCRKSGDVETDQCMTNTHFERIKGERGGVPFRDRQRGFSGKEVCLLKGLVKLRAERRSKSIITFFEKTNSSAAAAAKQRSRVSVRVLCVCAMYIGS